MMPPKRNVAFIKPDEPSFLKKLKAQVGYREGPTIDTKREELEAPDENDLADNDEEQPTVVVLKAGDLTAEEVAAEKDRLEREAESAPADLNKPIVFKAPSKKKDEEKDSEKSKKDDEKDSKKAKNKPKSKNSSKKGVKDKRLLSFNDDEEDDA